MATAYQRLTCTEKQIIVMVVIVSRCLHCNIRVYISQSLYTDMEWFEATLDKTKGRGHHFKIIHVYANFTPPLDLNNWLYLSSVYALYAHAPS